MVPTNQATMVLFCFLLLLSLATTTTNAQSSLCRSTCGDIPISYPFGVDDGCGSPYYRNLVSCHTSSNLLLLRTPSGAYPVRSISYSDPHLVVSDPSMLSCTHHATTLRSDLSIPSPPPFSLDTSTRLSLSPKNDFLFFNCSPDAVIVQPKPAFCDRFPDRCDSACDSAGYLCRNLPGCPQLLADTGTSCCSYYPKASESVRMMLRHCGGYATVYWRTVGENVPVPYDQVPEYGVRVDFDIPVTTSCRQCREKGGGGVCGFDTRTRAFLCLCDQANVTAGYCGDGSMKHSSASIGVIAGTTTVVSAAGLAGAGALIWFLRKMKANKVTCGVQTNDNRLF